MTRRGLGIAAIALASITCARPGGEEDSGNVLRVGFPAPAVQKSTTLLGITYHRNALTREALVSLGADGRPVGRVLESWETSPDGLTWRLKVRPGITFNDGRKVTSNDVADFLLDPAQANVIPDLRAARADGDFVVVDLNRRFRFLLEALAQATFERVERTQDADGKVVETRFGTGAYTVVSESAEQLTVQARPQHYRGRPAIGRIDVRLFPDQRNAWSALMRQDIDLLYEVSRQSLEFVRAEGSVDVATFPRPYVYLLGLNHSHPRLGDPRVRRALNQAVDREAFVRLALAGEGEPAIGHIWPKHWAFDPSVAPPSFDPAESIRLLEAAGLTLEKLPGRMPARLRLRCIVYSGFERMALIVQRQLAQIDVDLQVEIVPLLKIPERLALGDYDTFVFEMTSARTLLWPYRFWHSKSGYFRHGYTSADAVLDRMREAPDEGVMRAAAVDLQRLFVADPPAVFLAWGRVSRAVSRRFTIPETDDDVYHTIAQWRPATKGGN